VKKPKIIGLVTAWGAENWIRPAIKQALEYCDEVTITVAAHSPQLKEVEDNTYEICKEYSSIRLIDYETSKMTVNKGRCEILNYMLRNSKLHSPGNWIWMLDVDEYYTEQGYKEIKSIIENGEHDKIRVEEKFFFINMRYYLEASHNRLARIETMQDRFKPTDKWSRKARNEYVLSRKNGMFHYSLLADTRVHRIRWKTEYPGTAQPHKVKWLDEIYPNYEIEREDYWNGQNLKMFGIKSPLFNKGAMPDENGRLFRYDGKHPKFIEELGFPEIEDFRKWYKK